jgi:hypothetical protein
MKKTDSVFFNFFYSAALLVYLILNVRNNRESAEQEEFH